MVMSAATITNWFVKYIDVLNGWQLLLWKAKLPVKFYKLYSVCRFVSRILKALLGNSGEEDANQIDCTGYFTSACISVKKTN